MLKSGSKQEKPMRKLTIVTIAAAVLAAATQANAAETIRFCYTVQVHQANMMV
jgi:hypothetical protein